MPIRDRVRLLSRLIGLLVLASTFAVGMSPPASANEAEEQLGTWTGVNSTIRLTRRLSGFVQGEVRTWDVGTNLNEVLGRVAGHYKLSESTMFAVGYVRADTWGFDSSFGARKRGENRLYQQFAVKHGWGRAKLDHRFRLEQRFFREAGASSYGNRVRYMIGLTLPLRGDSVKCGSYFLRFSNETFLNFESDAALTYPERNKTFDQNRVYVGAGRQLTRQSKLQLGLLWQARPDRDFFRVQLTYTHNFDLRRRR
jgi:hypothetical protein